MFKFYIFAINCIMKIIMKFSAGFGNKVFNAILGLYLLHTLGGKLYGYIKVGYHDDHDKYAIYEVFKNLTQYYTFITHEEKDQYLKLKTKDIHCKNIKSLKDLESDNEYEVINVVSASKCYRFIYDMYNALPDSMKNVFVVDQSILSTKVKHIVETEKYICVHVRYGDKLKISLFDKHQQFKFLIYTPKFYKKIIKKFLSRDYKVYVVTDDKVIVKKFIIDDIASPNVEVLNTPSWDDYHLLSNSNYNILSISTFSISASLINKKLKGAFIVSRPNDIKSHAIPEEELIDKFLWTKIMDKSYILNYNIGLMRAMFNSRI